MGFIIGFIKNVLKLLIYSTLVAAIIILIPNLPPYTTFSSIELEPTQPRTGPLAPNELLNNPEKLFEGKLLGPEMFQLFNGDVYTGLATGEIVKVSPQGHVTFVTKVGKPCTGIHEEHVCGRPLGFVIDDKTQQLYVADAYYGIWKVDLRNDKKQLLVSPQVPINGRTPKVFNDVALDKNGDVYWTDSSSEYHLRDGSFAALADPSGRLLRYDAVKNESKTLIDKMWFANGVVVSPDNEFVLVAESTRYRILKYFIEGPNKGKSEVFVAGLPGLPDTVRALPDGSGVLVALYTVFDDEDPLFTKSLSTVPLARKLISRVLHLAENIFDSLNKQFPHPLFEGAVYRIGHFATTAWLLPDKSGLVQIDWNGKIVASYFNTDKKLMHISDAIVYGDKLYTGCPHEQDFIGAVPAPPLLKKAFTPQKSEATKSNVVQKKTDKEPQINKETKKTQESKPPVQKVQQEPKPATVKPVQKVQQEPKPETVKPPVPKTQEKPKPTTTKPQTEPKKVDNVKPTIKAEPSQQTNKKPEKVKVVNVNDKVNPNDGKVKREENMIEPNEKKEATGKTNDKEELKLKQTADKPKTVPKEIPKAPTKEATQPKVETEKSKPVAKAQVTKEPENSKKVDNTDKKRASPESAKPSKPEQTKAKESIPEKPKPKTENKQIPIVEEIPSDTAKPAKENLKVIKKSGPVEIPNPNL